MNDDLPIRLARADEGVATLVLCRPATKNLITHAFVAALRGHALALAEDSTVRCVLLHAEGPMFCAGADVRDMLSHLDDLPAHIDGLITPAHAAMAALAALSMPVVGCVQGTAAGGGFSLALACDLLVAARSARFVFAYPQLGTTPDCGLSHALAQRLGPARALHLYLARDRLTADEAFAAGLVGEVVDDAEALPAARRLAQRIATLAPQAVRGAKRLFLAGGAQELQARLDAERASFLRCAATREFRARVAAFGARNHG